MESKLKLGAKRHNKIKTPQLREDLEEEFVEKVYVESLNSDLKDSKTKLMALDKLKKEILSENSYISPGSHDENNIFLSTTINSAGVMTHNPQGPQGPLKLENFIPSTSKENSIDGVPADLHEIGIRRRRHPRTIRKYVAVLLSFFSNLETEYVNDEGIIFIKKLPVFYASKEKLISIEDHEFKEITNGNTNFLPRASLILDGMEYDPERQMNKSLPIKNEISMDTLKGSHPYAEVTWSPSPYKISCRLSILTRGVDDALMILEQIGSYFNPFFTLNITDNSSGIDSSIRLKLEGMTLEPQEHEEYSQNEVLSEINFTLYGNLFKNSTKEYLADSINITYSI